MTVLKFNGNQLVWDIESKLNRMRELEESIKVLTSEYAMLKNQVITEHFINHDEYRTERGFLLASYKSYESLRFNQKDFKKVHPSLFEEFQEKMIAFKFLLK